jgi:peptidoglycan-associated lipoprotein
MRHASFLAVSLLALASLAGCAKKPKTPDEALTTSKRAGVNVSDELLRACKIHLENVSHAPKFDFDDADLLPEDRDVLEQVARCVTTGPLKGRSLSLVGRCDPRGETEYNMVLGDYRAASVQDYLAKLGVADDAMAKTSRGELDAEGKDEAGWRLDRRVDVALQPAVGAGAIAQRAAEQH